jgi:DNA-binding transcriptional MerR regulator
MSVIAPAGTVRVGEKSPTAFRTIAEVATDLDLPQHVLRFWESRFPQVKPLKRRGGRRYYRPEDIALLRVIRGLLYDEGYTIKGVQRLLREGEVRLPAEAPLPAAPASQPDLAAEERLHLVRDELKRVLKQLEQAREILKSSAF